MSHVEPVTATWLTGRFPAARVVTETPADLSNVGTQPIILVVGLPGGQHLVLGRPMVDVECYGATRDAARTLAGQVHNALLFEMRGLIANGVVTTVKTTGTPAWRPYSNTNVRRFGATYQVYLHDAS